MAVYARQFLFSDPGDGRIRALQIKGKARAALLIATLISASSTSWPNNLFLGTVIVASQGDARVIIAADSRTHRYDRTGVNDTYCKITALDGPLVFAAGGLLGGENWDSNREFSSVAARYPAKVMNESTGTQILDDWARALGKRMTSRDEETTGILFGFTTGRPWGRSATVKLNERGPVITPHALVRDGSPIKYWIISKKNVSSIVEEFISSSSDRAIQERTRWTAMGLTGRQFELYKVKRLVELAILYSPDSVSVGGDVDEIEIDAAGVHWMQAKPQCKNQ